MCSNAAASGDFLLTGLDVTWVHCLKVADSGDIQPSEQKIHLSKLYYTIPKFWRYNRVWHDKCCPRVTPQSAAKTICIVLDCNMHGPVSQFLLRVYWMSNLPVAIRFTDSLPATMCETFFFYLILLGKITKWFTSKDIQSNDYTLLRDDNHLVT